MHLLLLATAAALLASSVSSVVRSRLTHSRAVGGEVTPIRAPGPAAAPLDEYLEIARRGIFADVPLADTPIAGASLSTGPTGLRLLGTGGDGARRFAVLEDPKDRRQLVLRIGQSIGDAEVVEIGWRRVLLRRGSEEELLIVPADLTVGPSGPGNAVNRPPVAAASSEPSDGAVRDLGGDRYLVAKAEVDHQLQNLSQVFTQMRAVPNLRDGKTDGFRVFAIRRGSIFDRIGLQNNDVVQRINGVELTDPARAMGLLQELQSETRLSVDVLRGGAPRTLSYEIR